MSPASHRMSALAVLAAAGLLTAATCATAQTQTDGQWHGGIVLGGSFASGNTTSRALTANGEAARATVTDKTTLYGILNNGQTKKSDGTTTKTADQWRAGGRYDYNLSSALFAFGGSEVEGNKLQGLDSRVGLNGGLGYKVLREERITWDVFGGVGWSRSRFSTGETRRGSELVLGEESTHKLGESSSFKQRLVYYPGQSSIGNRATFDAMLSTAITGAWTLNVGASARYASKVPTGNKKVDTLTTVGFGYKF